MSESELPRYLVQLDDALADLPDDADAMLLSEVDGYITGLALMPEEVPDAEWLPLIWRPDPATPDYLYHDTALLDEIADHARRHFRAVSRDLHRGEFEPIYDIGREQDEILWQFWIAGFGRAMSLRPDALAGIADAAEDVHSSFTGLFLLSSLADRENEAEASDGEQAAPAAATHTADNDDDPLAQLSDDETRSLAADAPDLIPEFIAVLYEWTRTRRPTPDFAIPVRRQQVGRNDPCPCGSGRKYKKCCGANGG